MGLKAQRARRDRRRRTPPRGGRRSEARRSCGAEGVRSARRPNLKRQPPAPAPPQTAAESLREWAPAMGAVKLEAGTPPSCPPAAGRPAPRSGGAWRKNAAGAPQDGSRDPPPSLKPAHTSLADTCQRLHTSCTTRLSKHWIPVLDGFGHKAGGQCPELRDAQSRGDSVEDSAAGWGGPYEGTRHSSHTRAAPHTRG